MKSMKKEKLEEYCKGVRVGSKGQIVIPVELREDLNINPGDTVILCKRGCCIEIVKSELIRDTIEKLAKGLA
jgi:AbrB family looped-hinge helix DNA binding protein